MSIRRQFLAARRREREGIPDPKFRIGDIVMDPDGSSQGVVKWVGEYRGEDYGGWAYRVLDDSGVFGPNGRFRTEAHLVLVKRPRRRR